jgi:hypothetical protein
MTLITPQLALKRLILTSRGIRAYDERFHHGVNIIRGVNGGGKSTIADFIFYCIGGELTKLTPEAARCEEVLGEWEINNEVITIRRLINTEGKQPLMVFFGSFEDAEASVTGWQHYSMQRSEKKESASQLLFRALGFPEVKGDVENNITMYQLLRLIYVDQLSSVHSLMRDERFDSPVTREAVGDLLLGLYDDLLYNEMRLARQWQKDLEAADDQINVLHDIVLETDIELSDKAINAQLAKLNEELSKTDALIKEASVANLSRPALTELKKKIDALAVELLAVRQRLTRSISDYDSFELEIADSNAFIQELRLRLAALNESVETRKSLGQLPLTHCPQCLSELHQAEKNTCPLCRQPFQVLADDSRALRMKQELGQQIKESETMLQDREEALAQLKVEIPTLKGLLKAKEDEYRSASNEVTPGRDPRVDQLFIRKGAINAEIVNIHRQAKVAAMVAELQRKKANLKSELQTVNFSITRRKQTMIARKTEAAIEIQKQTLRLLKKDLDREEMFSTARDVEFDFRRNTFAVDGRNHFSASAIVYLRNSIHFGIFFASLQLPFFRYPRFILCDNMEDKGMEQIRSQNFQREIVALSKASSVEHQIIFTTSMIDPSLNGTDLCIGPEYTRTRKSLNLPQHTNPGVTPDLADEAD